MRCCAPSSASDRLDLGRCRKTLNCVPFRIEGLEHSQQFRNRQEIGDALCEIEQLEAAALPADGRVRADNLAQAGTIEVRDLGQIQNDFAITLADNAVNLVLEQFIAFP